MQCNLIIVCLVAEKKKREKKENFLSQTETINKLTKNYCEVTHPNGAQNSQTFMESIEDRFFLTNSDRFFYGKTGVSLRVFILLRVT